MVRKHYKTKDARKAEPEQSAMHAQAVAMQAPAPASKRKHVRGNGSAKSRAKKRERAMDVAERWGGYYIIYKYIYLCMGEGVYSSVDWLHLTMKCIKLN